MNRLSSILGAMAVVAIAVVFIVQFRPATNAQMSTGPTCAAEIRGQCLPATHFWASYRLLAPRNADADRLRAMGLRNQVLEGLVDRFVLAEDAKRLGITVSDEDITRELANGRAHVSLPAEHMAQLAYPLGLGEDMVRYIPVKNHTTKKFDPKVYEKEVRGLSKMSPSDFRDFQREEILAQRMRDIVRERVHVGEGEAFAQFGREKSTATVAYVKLDRRFYVEAVIDTSPKAVEAWSEKNKDELSKVFESRKSHFLPECRVLRHILAKVDPNAIDPEDAKAKAKKRIEEAQERLKKGDDFGDVARDVSDDPSSIRGGDLGCVQKGKMV
ncbi:MAG TPA: SurA N-terminal domain-containing protein, partial [Polyangiaceae bacterium]